MPPAQRGSEGVGSRSDPVDVARFDRLGDAWWDPNGPMGALHKMNPARVRYLRDLLARHFAPAGAPTGSGYLPLAGFRVLDIGCGGGLLCEPLARLGAVVTGIDAAPGAIEAARRHAAATGVFVTYRADAAEHLAAAGESFDAVLAMEVVEHVPDPAAFLRTACGLVRPGGLLVVATLNRTAKSFLLAIVGAEYVLRWLPRGTHRWSRFLKPEEVSAPLRGAGLRIVGRTGLAYDPVRDAWAPSRDTDVNYMLAAARPGPAIAAPS